jgi:hypothetical protein
VTTSRPDDNKPCIPDGPRPEVPLSIELLHVYPWRLTAQSATQRASREVPWLSSNEAKDAHHVIMIDDYFLALRGRDTITTQAVHTLLSVAQDKGIRIDHVVRESALSHTAVEMFSEPANTTDGKWACAELAAAFQLVRLGIVDPPPEFVITGPKHFPVAQTVCSVLNPKFLTTELEVQTLLASLPLEAQPNDRISYVFC